MKYLIVKPVGGLANRIRVVESAYSYAKSFEARLFIIWERNGFLNARFSECFVAVNGVKIIETDYNGFSVVSKIKRKFFDIAGWLAVSFFAKKNLYDSEIESILINEQANEQSNSFFNELSGLNKGIYIETCFAFYSNTFSHKLTIQEYIQKKAVKLLKQYSSIIGIHIRRTDNTDSIQNSPIEKFVEQIKTCIEISPSNKFYLSTDSEEVVHQLRDIFKEKIITGVSVRERDSKEGIISALTDLCCLSQCKIIFGSYRSSFSERAAIIGNIPLQIVSG